MTDTEAAARGAGRSLAEQAYAAIREGVLDARFAPGAYMLEKELADLLEMSRTPVREALVRLANEGMVEIRPRHGMRVLPISADDMAEIYTILTALESEVAAEVAARGLPAAELAALKASLAAMTAALDDDDLPAWTVADEAFHRRLVENSGNRRIRAVIQQFWDQAHRVRMLTLRIRPKPTASNADHEALVAAIEVGDADRARELHREHRLRNGAMLVALLRDRGLTQL